MIAMAFSCQDLQDTQRETILVQSTWLTGFVIGKRRGQRSVGSSKATPFDPEKLNAEEDSWRRVLSGS